jgi:hypothetical protein
MRHGKVDLSQLGVSDKLNSEGLEVLYDNIMLNAFRISVNGSLSQQGMVDGISDEYEDETGIDTGSSTNESYDSINDLYTPDRETPGINTDTKLIIHGNDGDSSGQAHVITYIADAKIDASTYKFGKGSLSVDGTGDYIVTPSSADWNFGTAGNGDFTIDFWLYFNSLGMSFLFSTYPSAGWYIYYQSNLIYLVSSSVSWTPSIDTWYHMAIIRNGSTITLYVNGTSQGTFTDIDMNNDGGALQIGGYITDPNLSLDGYMDGVRITKGEALWTSNFTAPTSAPTADANTKLLLNFEGGDQYGGHDVSPKGSSAKVTRRVFSQCAFFDGTGDYLSISDSADWAFGNGDFTQDFWINFSSIAGNIGIIGQAKGGVAEQGFYCYYSSGIMYWRWRNTIGTRIGYNISWTPTVDTWYHLAFVRNGSNFYWFINGVSQSLNVEDAIGTTTLNDCDNDLTIGRDANIFYLNGYMDEIRITKGEARWTSDFTLPTAAYTSDTNTKLLLHCDGTVGSTTFTDSGNTGHTVTANGNVKIDDLAKFGTGSWRFDGSSDYLELPDSVDWDICLNAVDNWTIDFWVKHTDHVGQEVYIRHREDASNYWTLEHSHGSGMKFELVSGGGIIVSASAAGEITDTNWHHIALCKVASKYAIYKDGTQINYTDDSSVDTFTGILYVGWASGAGYFDGYMDENS